MRGALLSMFLAGLLTGCGGVNVQRVGEDLKPIQGVPKGFFVYMNRPYVAVYKPMPLDTNVMLVDGIVSADGKYVLVTGSEGVNLSGLMHFRADSKVKISSSYILGSGDNTPNGQSALDSLAKAAANATGKESTTQPTTRETNPAPTSQPVSGGTLAFRVDSNLSEIGQFPFRDYFDILFLPDFEERYLVQPKANFGAVSGDMTLGAGGMLKGVGYSVNNSMITTPLIDAYASLVKFGTKALETAVSAASGVPLPTGQSSIVAIPSKADLMTAEGGTPVTLRISVVKFAAPGLYPILKHTEMTSSTQPVSVEDHILVPKFPYTRVAYKYFEVILVEQVLGSTAAASPFQVASPPLEQQKVADGNDYLSTDENKANSELNASLKSLHYEVVSIKEKSPFNNDATHLSSATVVIKRTDGTGITDVELANLNKQYETNKTFKTALKFVKE